PARTTMPAGASKEIAMRGAKLFRSGSYKPPAAVSTCPDLGLKFAADPSRSRYAVWASYRKPKLIDKRPRGRHSCWTYALAVQVRKFRDVSPSSRRALVG